MDRLDLYVMHPFAAARMKILTESVFYKHLLAIVRNLLDKCKISQNGGKYCRTHICTGFTGFGYFGD